jgi:outer membrane protein assembly factor BamD (BamD/ComL family)
MRYITFALLLFVLPVNAAYTMVGGKAVASKDTTKALVQEQFQRGVDLVHQEKWKEAEKEFRSISTAFPNSSFAAEGEYYRAVCDYWQGEYEDANAHADNYLKSEANPPFFTQALEVKFFVAEAFRKGGKRHMFARRFMPKWVSGKTQAVDLYDEVVAASPSSSLAARSLFGKAQLLFDRKEYEESIEAYKAITRRFPTHELALESYLAIAGCYLVEAEKQFQNPDLLSRAELNARKFEESFPGEERVDNVYAQVNDIREIYATGLLDTAKYYERKKKPNAALVYYQRAVERFPETEIASVCRERLQARGVEPRQSSSVALFGEAEKVQ